jgi:hypothetical protein
MNRYRFRYSQVREARANCESLSAAPNVPWHAVP